MTAGTGPLAGIRVVEFAGLGPVPYCGMLLADMGAEVVVVARDAAELYPVVSRGKSCILADLKTDGGRQTARAALACADVALEGFRPGVMERLGLGPQAMRAANPRLIFARATGWGQEGPLADKAGHDLTYIAITGALDMVTAPAGPARPPLNLLGDFAGGSMFLLTGVLAALVERAASGQGQVVDAAIVDGVASLMATNQGFIDLGVLPTGRGEGLLGGSAPNYRCYVCADGRELAVAAIEPQFLGRFLAALGLPVPEVSILDMGDDSEALRRLNADLAAIFATRPRDEWVAHFADIDACVAPVLTLAEASVHPYNVARGVFLPAGDSFQPGVAPRFGRTPGVAGGAAGLDGSETLRQWQATGHG